MKIETKPKGRQTRVQGFSLYPSQIKKIDELAQDHGISRSELIRQAIDQMPPPKRRRTKRSK